jgi:hypothetical protein
MAFATLDRPGTATFCQPELVSSAREQTPMTSADAVDGSDVMATASNTDAGEQS